MIAERDLRGEERIECRWDGERAAIEAGEDLVPRFQGAGHLEIGELRAKLIASREDKLHQATSSTHASASC